MVNDIHKKQRSFGTHSGTFHADEVTACALLLLFDLIDANQIIRSRDPVLLTACDYLCDVGGEYHTENKRFDHHQSEYDGPLSSAGMVWKYLYDMKMIDRSLYNYLNRNLIIGIDQIDTGMATPQIGHCGFSQLIINFLPVRHDVGCAEMDRAFMEAVKFAKEHIQKMIERYQYNKKAGEIVKQVMKDCQTVLMFDESLPWLDAFFEFGGAEHPAKFLVMPTQNQWKVRGIPPSYERRMEVRVPMPKSWSGLMGKELQEASGIDGAVFCHKGRFISIWESKEDALKALEKML